MSEKGWVGFYPMSICFLCSPFSFTDGREALETLKTLTDKNLSVRAIILDLTVPGGMGGKATVREIRKVNSVIPVFVASGYSEDAAIANPEEFGFTAGLEKPFSISELAQMFEKHLGS